MNFAEHARLTGTALRNWFIAQMKDSLAVGVIWLVGLWIIGVPWAPLWALLGAIFQFVPNFGPLLSVIGPAAAALFFTEDAMKTVYVLILYACIAVVDGLWLQPFIMKRTVKVPIWASIVAPIVLGVAIPFWGILLAAPLLAVVYAYREQHRARARVAEPGPPPLL